MISYADTVVTKGWWGYWRGWTMRPNVFYFACGARMRIQSPQGSGDDTAANGLQLKYCHKANWAAQLFQLSWAGNWGGWTYMKMCPKGKYIYSMNARLEFMKGLGDDTSLNGLMVSCRYPNGSYPNSLMIHPGYWGAWKGWSKIASGYHVCGTNVRYENPKGRWDDTALNGLALKLCSWV